VTAKAAQRSHLSSELIGVAPSQTELYFFR
jgi:hypothetical protein